MPLDKSKFAILFLGIIAILALGSALFQAQTVIIPLIIAWLMSQLLGPLVVFFVRHKVPTSIAITLVMVLLVVGLYYVGVFIAASATQFLSKLPTFQDKFLLITNDIIDAIAPHIEGSEVDVKATIREELANIFGSIMLMLSDMVKFLTTSLFKLLTILIMVAFMLVGKPFGEAKIKKALSPDMADRVQRITASISNNISQYLFLQFAISLITGLLMWFVCETMGVESAITWGALGFFLNFIPTIGSIIACIPPILLSLLQNYPNYWPAVILAVILIVIQQVMGNVVSPKVMGDRLNLSPVVILLSLLFWGWLWGITGALLSVVIAASIKIVCDNIEPLKPIGIMMESGKAAAKVLSKEAAAT